MIDGEKEDTTLAQYGSSLSTVLGVSDDPLLNSLREEVSFLIEVNELLGGGGRWRR
jgi:hypothetical protein